MNTENILKLAEYIEGLEPKEYDQRYVDHPTGPHCGTPACIAGHAAYLSGMSIYPGAGMFEAKAWLRLSSFQADCLFDSMPFGPFGTEPDISAPTPQDAAATLRHLAETGEVDWLRAKQ